VPEVAPSYSIDDVALARLFTEYAATKEYLQRLEAQIQAAVLERGESVKIAGVTAKYMKAGFETPDYQVAAQAAMPHGFDLSPFQTVTTSTKWAAVCAHLGIEVPQGAEKPARVLVS